MSNIRELKTYFMLEGKRQSKKFPKCIVWFNNYCTETENKVSPWRWKIIKIIWIKNKTKSESRLKLNIFIVQLVYDIGVINSLVKQ